MKKWLCTSLFCALLLPGMGMMAAEYTVPDGGSNENYTLEAGDSLEAGYTSATSAASNGTVTLNGAAAIGVPNGAWTLNQAGIVSGAGSFTKTGTGTLNLSGANTYTGGTTVSAGTLNLGHITGAGTGTITLGDMNTGAQNIQLNLSAGNQKDSFITNSVVVSAEGTGNVTLLGNAKFSSLRGALVLNRAATFSVHNSGGGDWWYGFYGTLSGSGALTIQGGAGNSNRFVLGGSNTGFTGGVTIQSGKLQIDNTNACGTAPIVLGNAQTGTGVTHLHVNSNIANTIILSDAAPDSQPILSCNETRIYKGDVQISRDLTIYGQSDRFTFQAGKWTGTGNVTIANGGRVTVESDASGWFGDVTVNANTVFQITGANSITANSSVVVKGTFQLNGVSSTIDGLSGSGTVQNIWSSNMNTLTVGAGGASSTFDGIIKDNTKVLAITKAGAGTLTLTGASTYTGPTTVAAGTLFLDGGSLAGSDVTVLEGATFRGDGAVKSLVLDAGSKMNVSITSSTDSDQIQSANDDTLSLSDGSLEIVETGYDRVTGEQFTLLTRPRHRRPGQLE